MMGWPVALRLAVPLALLAVLWQLADGAQVTARLAQADPVWLVAAVMALNLQTLLSALRWRLVAAALGAAIGLRHAVAEYYLSQLVNQTLPGGVLGDAARALRAGGRDDLARAATAVVIERLAGQLVLFATLFTALAVALMWPGGIDWPQGTGLALWSAGLAGAGLCGWFARRAARGGRFAVAVQRALPGQWRVQLPLGLAILACNLAAFACAARATGTTLPVEAILTLIPLILTAMLLPLGVGGWGWREGAAAGLFPLAGFGADAGLAASLAFGGLLLLSGLPGLYPLWRAAKHTVALPVGKSTSL
ncbi:flippase-like domain-containing protein [Fertoebacter nigrum]|uniref:Flippase-like domain-containing protein n=1 Tax=Fertoeibacter niger TaxID=2656921 RepID=A0A8X8H1R3_9RHOB|nr:lysylphosphatidylglycerol synthase transmembrane domain-containing protein [Fertoeibacter niger]NUB45460.1 flippase-like domain-containing protein [Fertoeibacter niger]